MVTWYIQEMAGKRLDKTETTGETIKCGISYPGGFPGGFDVEYNITWPFMGVNECLWYLN